MRYSGNSNGRRKITEQIRGLRKEILRDGHLDTHGADEATDV